MARRMRRRFNARRARSFVRRTVLGMGEILPKRALMDLQAITASTTVNQFDAAPTEFDLLVCQESQDDELEADGTNVPTAPLYSSLVGIKLQLMTYLLTAGQRVRWMLYKQPDGESLATTTLLSSRFHDSADDAVGRELRGLVLAKGMFVASDKTAGIQKIFVRRSALRRIGRSLRENDRIAFVIENSATSSAGNFTLWGTLYVRSHN